MQDEGWKLNRAHYYQEGWLSTANLRGVVGVTYTSSNCVAHNDEGVPEPPFRTNYNLRGHRSEVYTEMIFKIFADLVKQDPGRARQNS